VGRFCGGIPETEDILLNKGFQPQDRIKRATLRKAITDVERLDFQPGERWAYNNPNYFLLAEVVERRSGQPLGGYLKTRIFEPLHLKMSVGYDSPVPGKATSDKYNNLNQPRVADWRWDAFGSGGLQTTRPGWWCGPTTTAAARWAEPTSNETSSPARCRPP